MSGMDFTILYQNEVGVTMPIPVEAPDEDTAKMRAGMRRAELTRFPRFGRPSKWRILSITTSAAVGAGR